MKNLIPIIGLCSLISLSVQAQSKDDTAAIKAVIEKETTSFFGVDHKNWETNWVKTPYAYSAYADSTGSSFVEGFEIIDRNFKEYFQTAKPTKSKIDRVWQEFRIYGKGAYVKFVQKVTDNIDRDETSETRVLEKDKDGKWKIVSLISIAKYPN